VTHGLSNRSSLGDMTTVAHPAAEARYPEGRSCAHRLKMASQQFDGAGEFPSPRTLEPQRHRTCWLTGWHWAAAGTYRLISGARLRSVSPETPIDLDRRVPFPIPTAVAHITSTSSGRTGCRVTADSYGDRDLTSGPSQPRSRTVSRSGLDDSPVSPHPTKTRELIERRQYVGVTDTTPAARARLILETHANPGSWQEVEELAHDVAPSDRAAAARLLILASELAIANRQRLQALGLVRSAVYIASRFHPSLAAEAGEAALVAIEDLNAPEEYFPQALELAHAFTATGLTDAGVRLASAVVARAEGLSSTKSARVTRAQALSNLASAHIRAEQFAMALEAVADARTIVPSNAFEVVGNIEYNEGLARAFRDEIGPARSAYHRSRRAFERGGDEVDLAYLDRVEAAAFARTGRYGEALDLYQRALETFRRRELDLEVEQTTVGLVQALSQTGRRWSDKEMDRYEAIALSLPPSESMALGLNITNIAHQQQDATRADRLYQAFVQMARDLNRAVDVARYESSYAVVLRERGDLDGAWRLNRSAAAKFEEAGLLRQLANADNNGALLLGELAQRTADHGEKQKLCEQAADHALRSIVSLDTLRHSLPGAADRRALQLHAYPHIFAVAIRACMHAERWDDVAAVVEKSRIQPVLAGPGEGFMDPAPLAARPGSNPVGGSGTPVILSALAGDGAWHGWWSDGSRLLRCRSHRDRVDVETGDLDRSSLDLFATALPIVLPQDLDAAGGDHSTAQLLALWRAASGPLLRHPIAAEVLGTVLSSSMRARLAADPAVAECGGLSADQLLWRLSVLLFADEWLDELRGGGTTGKHRQLVVAPPPLLGRVPWAALPLTDPSEGSPRQLVEVADVLVGLPATLAAGLGRQTASPSVPKTAGLVVADTLGDLGYARRLRPSEMQILGAGGSLPATRVSLLAGLDLHPEVLIVNAHVEPGSDDDPASSALLLRAPGGDVDRMRVAEFGDLSIPSQCVILGCDGAGAATGTEWTGLATGLVWAGATEVVTTTAPVIDDPLTAELDATLVEAIRLRGATAGMLFWQRTMAQRRRELPADPRYAPYRWAQMVALHS